MNNDRISNTPGGERILFGAIVFGLSLLAWQGLQYQLGAVGKWVLFGLMAYGSVQLGRGLFEWKYSDRESFAKLKASQNLLIDVPLKDRDLTLLNRIEDDLAELIRNSKTVEMDIYSIDTANKMGTIHLRGKNADAMYAHTHAVLSRFALPNGLHLFPKPGQPVDAELNGKRVLMDLPGMEISL